MANQNFRVKKGLEVGLGATFLYADDTGVGINSNAPRRNLDVRGEALIDKMQVGTGNSEIQAFDVVGTSTFTGNVFIDGDVEISGDLIFEDAILDDLLVTGVGTINDLKFNVGVGTTLALQDLSVSGVASINGAGIATIGGDPTFNSLTVTGLSTFVGFSTFGDNVAVAGTISVGGDIILDDLDAGNIQVGGTVFTNGLEFKVGIGSTLTVQDLEVTGVASISGAGIATLGGDVNFNDLLVTGISTFEGLAGFATDVSIGGDLFVDGDIVLEDIDAGNITVGGTVFTNGLEFNVGIGTTLIVTGISSLNIITGIGSELQYLPPASISTATGIGSTEVPPAFRPTGEPVQAGDLWFDSITLRQYTYYDDGNTRQWVDSNPPPTQPTLDFQGDLGPIVGLNIEEDVLNFQGVANQIITQSGTGSTIFIGLRDDIVLNGGVQAGGGLTASRADIVGQVSAGFVTAFAGFIGNLETDSITVGDVTIDNLNSNNLRFNSGFGTALEVVNLNVTGIATLNGAGIATLGGDANFENLNVTGLATVGPTSVFGNLYVAGDIDIAGDIVLDEIEVRNVTVDEQANLNQLGFQTGIGTNLTVNNAVAVGGTFFVGGTSFLEGTVEAGADVNVVGDVSIGGTVQAGDADFDNITTPGNVTAQGNVNATNITASGLLNGDNLTVTTANVLGNLNATTASVQDLGVSTTLTVTGITSMVGDAAFSTATGYDLTVERLTVPPGGFVDLPGIPVVGGAASFSQLRVTGPSTFSGIATFGTDVFIDGDLFLQGTQISDVVAGNELFISGVGTVNNLIGAAATIGVLSATNAYFDVLGFGTATGVEQYVQTTGAGIATVNDITVYNTIIDSSENVGVAGSVLTIDALGKLIWSSPEGAGISTDFAPGNTFYVSVNGSNQPDFGNAPTRPWASIAYALSQISPSVNDTLLITAGEYEEVFPVGGLEVPAGLTIKGAGQRATIIRPTVPTQQNDGFRLNDSTTIEDLTISGFQSPTVGSSPYVFQLSTSADIQTKSPYITRITIVNKGSVTTATDPYGYNAPNKGGAGIKIDGSLVTPTSIEAAILLNEVTMFVAGSVGIEMTSGARCEMVNSFIYFASQAILGEANLVSGAAGGFAGQGETRLAFNVLDSTPLPSSGDVIYTSPNGDELARGTISRSDTIDGQEYVYISGPGTGYFQPPSRRAAKTINFIGDAGLTTSLVPPLPDQLNPLPATSLDLTTTGSVCAVDLNADFGFGAPSDPLGGDFTVQLWVYFPTNAYGTDILDFRDNNPTDNAITISKGVSDFYEVKIAGVSVLQSAPSTAVTADWQQIAVSREGTTLRIFVDGVIEGTTTDNSNLGVAKPLEIGAEFDVLNGFEGYISDLKIDKGAATRNSNYAVPEEYLKSDIDTVLLVHFNGTEGATIAVDDIVTFQDITFVFSPSPEVQSIRLGDYTQFGADLRSVTSAVEYGAQGIVADGQGVELRFVAINFNYVGAGGDISNGVPLINSHDIEVIQQNNGKITYVSVDQKGDFRVGQSFFVNQETGEVSFTADVVDLTTLSSLTISDGANQSVITPTSGRFGDLLLSGRTIESVTGGMTLRPSGAGSVDIDGNMIVAGILTAQTLEINSIENGTTSIALDEDADIRFNVAGPEAVRFTSTGAGFGTFAPRADLDVIGQTQLENLLVTGVTTAGLVSATEIQAGIYTGQTAYVQNLVVVGVATLGAGGTEGGGTTIIEGNTVITGIVTIGENSTTISGIEGQEFIRAGSLGADFALLQAGDGATTRSLVNTLDAIHQNMGVSGVATVGFLSVTNDVSIGGSITIDGNIDLTGDITVNSVTSAQLDISGITTLSDVEITGVTTATVIEATDIAVSGAATVGGDLTVQGDLDITGDITFDEIDGTNLRITGVGTIGELDVTTDLTVGRNLLVSGLSTHTGFSTFTNDVWVGGALTVTDTTTVGFLEGRDANFSGVVTAVTISATNIEFPGGSGIGSNSIETERLNVTGITTTQDLEVVGVATITYLVADDGLVGNGLTVTNLTVTGDANISGSGIATIGSDPEFNSISIATTSTFGGVATFNDQIEAAGAGVGLTVTNDAFVSGSLTVEGDLNVTGDISYDEVTGRNLNITGVGTINDLISTASTITTLNATDIAVGGALTVTGASALGVVDTADLQVAGAATVTGNLSVGGDVDITGSITFDEIDGTNLNITGVGTIGQLDVTTDIEVGENVNVVGILTANELVAGPTTIGNDLTVTGDASINNDINVGGAATVGVLSALGAFFDGAAEVTGDLTVGGNLDIAGDISFDEIEGANLNITGISTLRDLEVTGFSTFIGFTTFTADVAVGGALTVAGNLDIAGEIELTGDITVQDITARNIEAAGIITALNAQVDNDLTVDRNLNVLGLSTVSSLQAADITVGGAVTVTGQSTLGFTTTADLFVGAAATVAGDLRIDGDLDIGGDITFDEIEGTNLNITGVGTITNLVSTAATISLLDVTTDISIGGSVTSGDLYVNGEATVAEGIGAGGTIFATFDLASGRDVAVGRSFFVVEDSLFGGNIIGDTATNISGINSVTATSLYGDDLTVTGQSTLGFTTTADLFVGSAATIASDLTVLGDLNVTGDISYDEVTGRNLNITGVGTINQLDVPTDLQVGGASTFTGLVEMSDANVGSAMTVVDLTVTGIANIGGSGIVTFGGDANFNNLAILGVSSFAGVSTFYEQVRLAGPGIGLTVDNDTFMAGDLTVLGEVNFSGAGGTGTGIGSDFVTTQSLVVTGIATLNTGLVTSLVVSGVTTLGVTTATDVWVGGALTVTGPSNLGVVTTSGDLFVGAAATIAGDLEVVGDIVIDGDITLDEIDVRNVNVSGVATFNDANFTGFSTFNAIRVINQSQLHDTSVSGDLIVAGITTLGIVTTANLFANGNSEINGNLTITGDLDIGGDIVFDEIDGRNLFVTGIGTIENLVSAAATIGVLSATSGVIDTLSSTDFDATTVSVAGSLTAGDGYFDSITFEGGTGIGSAFIEVPFFRAGIATIGVGIMTDLSVSGVTTLGFVTAREGYIGILTTEEITTDNISVASSITASDGYFNQITFEGGTGIGSAFIQVPFFQAGIATIGQLNAGISTLGLTTVFGDLAVTGNLDVTGDITYDEITGVNLAISGIATIQNLIVNAGSTLNGLVQIGIIRLDPTTGVITSNNPGVSTVMYYGDGSNLRNLPAATFQNDGTPTERPNGDPLQPGDLYFDETDLRQFTYYDDGLTSQWVDSNPPPTIPTWDAITDDGTVSVDTETQSVNILGNPENVVVTGIGITIGIGLSSTVIIEEFLNVEGDVLIDGLCRARDFDSTSDKRMKKNITSIDDALTKIVQLNGVEFNWRSTDESSAGVIAQDVEKVLPSVVRTDEAGYKSVNYNGIIGLLVEAVKELKAENDSLKKRLDKLE